MKRKVTEYPRVRGLIGGVGKRTVMVSVRVPTWLAELAERVAKARRHTVSELVRIGLEAVLNGEVAVNRRIL